MSIVKKLKDKIIAESSQATWDEVMRLGKKELLDYALGNKDPLLELFQSNGLDFPDLGAPEIATLETFTVENIAAAETENDISQNPASNPAEAYTALVSYTPTGSMNNLDITGFEEASGILFNSTSRKDLTGLKAPTDGGFVTKLLFNIGMGEIIIKNNRNNSLTANQFYTPDGLDVTIKQYGSIYIMYIPTLNKWVPLIEKV